MKHNYPYILLGWCYFCVILIWRIFQSCIVKFQIKISFICEIYWKYYIIGKYLFLKIMCNKSNTLLRSKGVKKNRKYATYFKNIKTFYLQFLQLKLTSCVLKNTLRIKVCPWTLLPRKSNTMYNNHKFMKIHHISTTWSFLQFRLLTIQDL